MKGAGGVLLEGGGMGDGGVPATVDGRASHGAIRWDELAVVLTGGGARAAYQVGVLRGIARRYPDLRFPIVTGVSAGAINAALLAQHHGTFEQAAAELASLWCELTPDRIFRVDVRHLIRNMGGWSLQLAGGGVRESRVRGLVETEPLLETLTEAFCPVDGELTGIDYNLKQGRVSAVALGTTSYTTGQSVVWVQGRDIETWERPQRRRVQTRLRIEHVMASAALPLFFPAVQIGHHWYGDGGIRLTAPLAPALHLGAKKILTVSNHYKPSYREADREEVSGYPPPAQVIGVLFDSIFLDVIDQDAYRLERVNELLRRLPEEERGGLRVVDILVLRPSRDLAKIAREYEPRLPGAFKLLTRGLGTRETGRPDVLSMVMFQQDYIRHLIEIGEQDAEQSGDEIAAFLDGGGA